MAARSRVQLFRLELPTKSDFMVNSHCVCECILPIASMYGISMVNPYKSIKSYIDGMGNKLIIGHYTTPRDQFNSLDVQNHPRRFLEPLKTFSADVWGFKYLLTWCLDVWGIFFNIAIFCCSWKDTICCTRWAPSPVINAVIRPWNGLIRG